ncbi:SDR family NAD(P)-dependent oxidoreductase, partial [Mycolicibacterium fallax]|uniref:SDR family NAD(P)-dependent oxidoreductase n=1 Tax=Mycolicibacterium fallax TaxID=1793 RepID=UPI0021F2D5DC
MELAHQNVLVTGGTAGIGLACARLFAREGASVVITGRDAERGRTAAAGVGGSVRFVQTDLADSVQDLLDEVGDIDVLVNNAASFPAALTVDQEMGAFERTFDTNVRGLYFLTAGLVSGMAERGHGAVVNVTTMVGAVVNVTTMVAGASKAAVESLTRTWAAEFGAAGVRVNSVAPGPTSVNSVAPGPTRTEGV